MILLDTHAWIWYLSNPELLSKKAKTVIEESIKEERVLISTISTWEVALLVAKQRLKLTLSLDDWIARSEALPFFQFIAVTNRIAIRSVNLQPPLHADPADRIIIATALTEGVPVVTKDEKVSRYPSVQTIW